MTRPEIVRLTGDDVEDILELWGASGLPIRPAGRDSRYSILGQIALPNCRFFALLSGDGTLAGAVIVNHEGRKGWINRLAVRPAARRAGIARALVRACEQWLHAEGIGLVAALVERENAASQSLFAACGYARDETLVYFRKVDSEDV